jgi:biofilm PGA synthesis N-glycosyltransferase PgaC
MAKFRFGMQDYALGGHPLWQVFRTVYQMTRGPVLAGGLMLGAGYCWALMKRAPRPISPELVAFRRREQMQRLRKFLTRNTARAPHTVERIS